jgi:hypothetical protein
MAACSCKPNLLQVLKRDAEGTVKRVENAKVAVFAQGVDTTSTETKVRGFDSRVFMLVVLPTLMRLRQKDLPYGAALETTSVHGNVMLASQRTQIGN